MNIVLEHFPTKDDIKLTLLKYKSSSDLNRIYSIVNKYLTKKRRAKKSNFKLIKLLKRIKKENHKRKHPSKRNNSQIRINIPQFLNDKKIKANNENGNEKTSYEFEIFRLNSNSFDFNISEDEIINTYTAKNNECIN